MQQFAVALRSDFLELVARSPGFLDVADGEQDLDIGRQQARPPEAVGRLTDYATDRRGRGVGVSLSQPQQRQAGLRLQAEQARLSVRLLSLRELASEAVDLTLQVARFARGGLVHRLFEPAVRALGLIECVRPRPLQLHQLGAVDQAAAGERQQVGLRSHQRVRTAVHSLARRSS